MNDSVEVLGIDPGSRVLGWGVVLWQGSKRIKVVDFGVIRIGEDKTTGEKLLEIHREINKIFDRIKPDAVAVEKIFYGKSFQSAMKIGEARGTCILAAAEKSLKTFSYTPAEVKSAVTGNGRAHKSQVQAMVMQILGLEKPPKPADAADALACAICHCNRLGLLNQCPPLRCGY